MEWRVWINKVSKKNVTRFKKFTLILYKMDLHIEPEVTYKIVHQSGYKPNGSRKFVVKEDNWKTNTADML